MSTKNGAEEVIRKVKEAVPAVGRSKLQTPTLVWLKETSLTRLSTAQASRSLSSVQAIISMTVSLCVRCIPPTVDGLGWY